MREVPVGRALQHEDMKTLAVIPSTSRTKESVAEVLEELAGRIGRSEPPSACSPTEPRNFTKVRKSCKTTGEMCSYWMT